MTIDIAALERDGVLHLGADDHFAHAVYTFGPWLLYGRLSRANGKLALSLLGTGQSFGLVDNMEAAQDEINRSLAGMWPTDTYRAHANRSLARLVKQFEGNRDERPDGPADHPDDGRDDTRVRA